MVQKTFIWKRGEREQLNRAKDTSGTRIPIQGLKAFVEPFTKGREKGQIINSLLHSGFSFRSQVLFLLRLLYISDFCDGSIVF